VLGNVITAVNHHMAPKTQSIVEFLPTPACLFKSLN
jgi:hypothetical protein